MNRNREIDETVERLNQMIQQFENLSSSGKATGRKTKNCYFFHFLLYSYQVLILIFERFFYLLKFQDLKTVEFLSLVYFYPRKGKNGKTTQKVLLQHVRFCIVFRSFL